MDATNTPATPSLAHQRQEQAARICRDINAGPLHVRRMGKAYLPQFPGEQDDAYADRLDASVLYDAFARTVNGLTGMVFRTPPKLADNLPKPISDIWENIDLLGTHGSVFCRERHRDGEIDGHHVIFVDMQRPSGNVRTLADWRRAKLRPYWIGIRKQDVLAATYGDVDGAQRLVHFRYRESVVRSEGYEQKVVQRIREYNLERAESGTRVAFIVWEQTGEKEWSRLEEGRMAIDEIPAVVSYLGDRLGPFESDPPHLALALENVKHYQLTSDNDNVLHLCSVPIYVRIGYERPVDEHGNEQAVGPTVGVDLPIGGDAKYVEPAGNGLEAMSKRIEKSEQRMAILGLSMLMADSRHAETATSKRINKAENDSALSSHAQGSQDGFEEAIRLTAKWLGIEAQLPSRTPEARWLTVSRDFEALQLDAQMVSAIASMVPEKLSHETLWDTLSRGGILDTSFDPALERERLEGTTGEALEALLRLARQPKASAQPKDEAA